MSTLRRGSAGQALRPLPFVHRVIVAPGGPGKLPQARSKGRADGSLLNLCLRHENLGDQRAEGVMFAGIRTLVYGEGLSVLDGVSGQPYQ